MYSPMVSPYLKQPLRTLDQALAARRETMDQAAAETPPQSLETEPGTRRQPSPPDTLTNTRRAA